jgi:general secretion pathway protein C
VRGGVGAEAGSAIIDVPGQGQRLVAVGDALSDGIVLEQVFADRVILNRRGARESLYLNDAARRRAQSGAAPAPVQASYGERRIAETWLAGLTLAPVLSDGAVRGLRVDGTSGALSDLGVQPGDIILTLNGTPLTSEAAAVRAFAQLDSADRAVARVERNGEIITVEASLR